MQKALPGKDAGKMEKHVFRIYDANNDGYIDFTEFMLVYPIMNDGTPEEVTAEHRSQGLQTNVLGQKLQHSQQKIAQNVGEVQLV